MHFHDENSMLGRGTHNKTEEELFSVREEVNEYLQQRGHKHEYQQLVNGTSAHTKVILVKLQVTYGVVPPRNQRCYEVEI